MNLDASQRIRIINDSVKIISNSKSIDTRLSRLDVLLEHANALLRYEQRGISTIDPPPSYLVNRFSEMRDQIILESLKADVASGASKAAVASTTQTKVNALSKVLLKIREYKSKADKPESLSTFERLERQVSNSIQKIQLEGYLNAAKKAEFKGQKKKALDQYYEALYFLKHDEIDDSIQKNQINFIESKITELGGSIR